MLWPLPIEDLFSLFSPSISFTHEPTPGTPHFAPTSTRSGNLSRLSARSAHSLPPATRSSDSQKLLQRIAQLTPVDTGRAQSSWLLAAQQLQPETAANTATPDLQITEGNIGSLSTITIVNQVPYMPFLELGTSQMSPFAMIRRAILEQIR